MSDYLTEEIINAFKNSFDKANPPLEANPKYGDLVYNTHIAPGVTAILEVANKELAGLSDPDAMFIKQNSISLIVPITEFSTVYDPDKRTRSFEPTLKEDTSIRAPLSTERLFPIASSIRSYGYTEPATFVIPRYEDANVEYICACIEYNSELDAKKAIAASSVKNLLNNFTTLNQALKAWPALSKLVDPDKLSKVHTKQERKRKQELHKEMADEIVINNDLNKTILTGALLGDEN
jgi:hypothetical protein